MRIDGAWFPGEDKTIRPIVTGLVRQPDGEWLEVSFLLDAGADRTVFSAAFRPGRERRSISPGPRCDQ